MNKSCPTCSVSTRETVGMVCQTCGMDYGQDSPSISIPWLVKRTGLNASTCLNLLCSGWKYVEQINKPPRWEHPIVSMIEPNKI